MQQHDPPSHRGLLRPKDKRRILAGAIGLVVAAVGLANRDLSEPAPLASLTPNPAGFVLLTTTPENVAGAQVLRPGAHRDEARVLARLEERRARVGPADLPALARTIVRESKRNGIDPELVLAVIDVESGYHLQAVSPAGARGLMQLMPATGRYLAKQLELSWQGDESLFDPQLNVTLGVAYLGQLKQRFGDIEKSLAAYNWGPSRIDRFLRNGQDLPRGYVETVFTTYESTRRPAASGS